jgi:hypothetical protein
MNRKERRRATKVKAVDIVEIFLVRSTANDEELGWFWYAHSPGTDAGIREAFAAQQMHGPFKSEAAAAADAFGGEGVRYGGMWDPAWNKPQ